MLGTVAGKLVAAGNESLFRELSVSDVGLEERAKAKRTEGETIMLVGIDGKFAGLFGVSDPIKPSAPKAIREVKANGLKLLMVTGDNRTTAAAVANKFGIDFRADVLPSENAEVVKALQSNSSLMTMATE